MKPETLGSLLAAARRDLTGAGIESAALDARLLLLAATGHTHEDLIAMPDHAVEPRAAELFLAYMKRRLQHEPVSRILGTREFYGRTFKVSPAVLDPRPDTEVVVELALKRVPEGRFIDLGTGSGIIAVTLCAENPGLDGLATDISPEALAVAAHNAEDQGVSSQLRFQQAAWFNGVAGKFELIISNPPYIPAKEALPPEVWNFDPHLALFGGDDGLASYRAIAQGARQHLMPGGKVVVEIGQSQADAVIAIFMNYNFILMDRVTDLGGRDRGLCFQPS